MLLLWQKNAFNYIPAEIDGYSYVCTLPVFIPHKRINLSILERSTQKIPFIHTCVLQAVNIVPMTVSGLSDLFGVDDKIIIEIVAALDEAKMVSIVAGRISISEIGRLTLEREAMVKITKARITDLYLNQITGEISEDKPVGMFDFPPKGQVYLDEEFSATLSYFHQHKEAIAQMYQNNSVSELFFRDSNQSTELYRITDIEEQHLCYSKVLCKVFTNIHDNSLMLQFPQDSDVYASAVKKQIENRASGVDKLFSRNRADRKNCESIDRYPIPDSIREFSACSLSKEEREVRMEELYFSTRTILDGELDDIFLHINEVHAKRLLIDSWNLAYFDINSLLSAINSPSVTELTLVTDTNSSYQANVVDQIRNGIQTKNGKLNLIPGGQQKLIRILVDDYCLIEGNICCSNTIYQRFIYSFHGTITFDQQAMKNIWRHYGF